MKQQLRKRKMQNEQENALKHGNIDGQNAYPDLMVLRPLSERIDKSIHPSQIIDVESHHNYYRYGWMQEVEPTSAMNIGAFTALFALIAATGYLLAGTKLLKFIQFFLTRKHYKRLNMRLMPDLQVPERPDTPYETGLPEFTPRLGGSASKRSAQPAQLLASTPTINRSGLIAHLKHHSCTLMQFYTPTLAIVQIASCSRKVTLPRYIVVWQLILRITFVVICAASLTLVFINVSLDEKTRNCLLSHETRANSFYCLNKASMVDGDLDRHNGALYALGFLAALISTVTMLGLSHSIFSSFTAYLDKLIEGKQQRWNLEEDHPFSKAPSKQLFIQTEETVPTPKKKRHQHDQSITSFRAMLERESDNSFMPMATYESGNESSGVGQMSMSTQAGLLNQSDRGGGSGPQSLFNMSQGSVRDLQTGVNGKRFIQAGGAPDLLPIDEDVDDEKCSPIKPKRRTDEDSPFKKHIAAAQMSIKKSQRKYEKQDEIDIDDVGAMAQIGLGGFGLMLDQDEINNEEVSSLNLNSGLLATPLRKGHSSPQKSVEMNLDELIENELARSEIKSQDGFKIQIEQIAEKDKPNFEGLSTLNKDGEVCPSSQEPNIQSGLSPKSMQINSFSNVDDSTLQLDTLGGGQFNHRKAPSSTRNGVMLEQNIQQALTQHPLSVRQTHRRPGSGFVNLGLITPFPALSSNNEEKTDDLNSLGFGQGRNTAEMLSSDNSCAVHPDSNQINKRKADNELLNEFKIEAQSEKDENPASLFPKAAVICFTATFLTFCTSLDAYFLLTAADEGLAFIITCIVAAMIFDLILQLILIVVLSATQLYCEIKRGTLPLNTQKLQRMLPEVQQIARQVFCQYEEQTALLKVGFQGEVERDPDNSVISVSKKDTLVKVSVVKILLNGFCVEIKETLKFRPPRSSQEKKAFVTRANLVRPNSSSKEPMDQMVYSSGDEEGQQRRRRPIEVGNFERSQKFFAGQISQGAAQVKQKHLRKSNQKKSAKILRASIGKIELENISGDFSHKKPDPHTQQKNSPARMSQFETPRMSKADGGNPSDYDQTNNEGGIVQDVQRKLSLRRSSNSAASDSNQLVAGHLLDSVKKYAEDDEDFRVMQGIILGNSSQSIPGHDAGQSEGGGLIRPATTTQIDEDVYRLFASQNEQKLSPSKKDVSFERADKYSPVFSSVNRRDIGKNQAQGGTVNPNDDNPYERVDIQTRDEQPIQASRGRLSYTNQPTSPAALNLSAVPLSRITASNKNESSSSQLVQALLSHREALSKQHSFNSPNSLHEKLQLTSEKIQRSIEKSSLSKGRRKMVMLDEAGISKQSLNFGTSNTNSNKQQQLSQVFRLHAKSIGSSSGSVTPLANQGASISSFKAPEPMGLALAMHAQNQQVLLEDQSDLPISQMLVDPLSHMPDYTTQKRQGSAQPAYALPATAETPADSTYVQVAASVSISQGSIGENKTLSARRDSLVGTQGSADKPVHSSSNIPSAFQRLVQASKRMMQKKSSEKKDVPQNKLNHTKDKHTDAAQQARSNSLTVTDTASIMKEQSKAFFQQPFKLGMTGRRSNNDSMKASPLNKRAASEKPRYIEARSLKRSDVEKPQDGESVDDQAIGTLGSSLQAKEKEEISEILEQDSIIEIETPMQRPRARGSRHQTQQQVVEQPGSNSSQYRVPDFFMKEQVNPVKAHQQEEHKRESVGANEVVTQSNTSNNIDYLKVAAGEGKKEKEKKNKGFKQRKNSQLIPTKEGSMLVNKRRKNSKNSLNVVKVSGSREKRDTSSREGTRSSLSIDFEKMSKQRDDEISEYSKLISQTSAISRVEDQRRRLESFLSLAQQAKSKRDIEKIQSMIRQIDETGKPLPMTRINELKFLELMASPYNQSLIAMIKVEFDMAKKVREVKKVHSKIEGSKSKFSLPKHLQSVPSRTNVINTTESQDDNMSQPCIAAEQSDTRLARVVNLRPIGISSCRSNNDVANGRFQQQSPLNINQPVLSGKVRRDSNDSSAAHSRYSYLRSVGNSVVATEDIRKSVDRIRMSHENEKHLKSKSDLDMLGPTRFEEIGRRGTAPINVVENEPRQKSSLVNYKKKPEMAVKSGLVTCKQSRQDLLIDKAIEVTVNNERSNTSYGVPPNQNVGTIMLGQNDFIKRIVAPQMSSKSALAHNKENQRQPKAARNQQRKL